MAHVVLTLYESLVILVSTSLTLSYTGFFGLAGHGGVEVGMESTTPL